MKILFFANGFYPAVGGTEIVNQELSTQLAKRGHELTLITWTPNRNSIDSSRFPFPVHYIPIPQGMDLYPVQPVIPILDRFAPDIALISRTSRRLKLLPPLLQKKGLPFAAFCHFLRLKYPEQGWPRNYFIRKRFGFNQSALILTVSACLAEQLEKMGNPKEKVRICQPGVDTDRFQPNPELRQKIRAELGFEKNTVLLTVANLGVGKGQERLLRVLPKLLQADPSLVYLVVGEGATRPKLEEQIRNLGLGNRVRLLGYREDPYPYFAAADLFAHPSNRPGKWRESFGLSILEASACGLPVVASKNSGAQEIVVHGETGFLVDESKEEEIANSLLQLIEKPALRNRMGEAARRRAISTLPWSRSGERLEELLREAMNRHWANAGSAVTSSA